MTAVNLPFLSGVGEELDIERRKKTPKIAVSIAREEKGRRKGGGGW